MWDFVAWATVSVVFAGWGTFVSLIGSLWPSGTKSPISRLYGQGSPLIGGGGLCPPKPRREKRA
jgi:hypothetical protein